jgi:hypothetical protein
LEERRVQSRKQQHQHDESEQRCHESNRCGLAGNLHRLNQQDEQCTERQDVGPEQVDGPSQEASAAPQRVLQLGQHHQQDREADRHADGPVEPRRVEHAVGHG